MATGGAHKIISFMPTTPPGPSATPTILSAPSTATGPGKCHDQRKDTEHKHSSIT